jgi:pimeloyl-ACP methyl ester carboxylesterase
MWHEHLDWLQPGAPAALRERVASMQLRAFELQTAMEDAEEAPDPLATRPQALEDLRIPVLAVAGDADMPDFKTGAKQIADRVPNVQFDVIQGAGHLAPLEAPVQFRKLLLGVLRGIAQCRSRLERAAWRCVSREAPGADGMSL